MTGKQKVAQYRISQSLAMIASLRSVINLHITDAATDPAILEAMSNRLIDEIDSLREVYSEMVHLRFEALNGPLPKGDQTHE